MLCGCVEPVGMKPGVVWMRGTCWDETGCCVDAWNLLG